MCLLSMDPIQRRHRIYDIFLHGTFETDPNRLYLPESDDIVTVGAPKSGTTWMQQILHQLRTGGDESFDDIYNISHYLCNSPDNRPYYFGTDPNQHGHRPRIYKHHEVYGYIPGIQHLKTIVIVRDPYDVVYSWLKFINKYYGSDDCMSETEMSDIILKIHNNNMGYFNFITSWWPHKDDPNVMLLFYEDLKTDLKNEISRIATFIGNPINRDDCRFEKIVEFCTFEYMAKYKERFQGETIIKGMASDFNMKEWKPKMGMVREDGGNIGQGSKHVGIELKQLIDSLWTDTVDGRFGFKSYKELYDQHSFYKTVSSKY